MEKIVFLSFIFTSFLGTHSYDPKECLLDQAKFLPFTVIVASLRDTHRGPETVAVGSIITPNAVLTVCTSLDNYNEVNLRLDTVQVKYEIVDTPPTGLKHGDFFHVAASTVDPDGCNQTRFVKQIFRHPRCPRQGSTPPYYARSIMLYNVAVLYTTEDFRNLTESLPVLPFVPDIATQLHYIDTFNSLRRERALLGALAYYPYTVYYMPVYAARALPFVSECIRLICANYHNPVTYSTCISALQNQTGFALCVRRVTQSNQGIAWVDYQSTDQDVRNDASYSFCPQGSPCIPKVFDCKNSSRYFLGMPLISRGVFIGMIAQCFGWGYTATSTYALRLFLNRIIGEKYKKNVIYMDATSPKPRYARFSNQGEIKQDEIKQDNIPFHSTSSPVDQGLLVFVGVVLLMLNNLIIY